jgi:hypothetical protein
MNIRHGSFDSISEAYSKRARLGMKTKFLLAMIAGLIFTTGTTVVVHAQVKGSTNLTVVPAASAGNQSLLSQCTYIGSGGCALPGGWTLVAQQDFECSGSHAIPANPGCGQLPGAETNGPGNGFVTTKTHGGSYAFGGLYSSDGNDVDWIYGDGTSSNIGSFSTVYISFWEYTDANAQYGNSDYYLAHIQSPTTCNGFIQDYAYDAEFAGNTAPISTAPMMVIANGLTGPIACQGEYQTGTAANLPMMAGQWRQVEILFKPSTIVTRAPTDSPVKDSGAGNGLSQLFINGVLNQQSPNADLNGTTSMANSFIEVGGVITDFCDGPNATIRANPFSKCPGTAPSAFHRYFDDIIVMKQ